MRYTYEIYDQTGTRRHICTRLDEAASFAEDINGKIEVFDNSTMKLVAHLLNADDILGWRTKLERDSSWTTKIGNHIDSKWNPFDEKETEIHLKEKPDEFDQVQFQKYQKERLEETVKDFTKKVLDKLPDGNAKTVAAVGKPKMSGIPPIAIMAMGAAMQDGVEKYGLFNWRDSSVTSTVFYDAILRHLLAWYSGERAASDSGIHHLAHAMAGCAILLDAEYNMRLNDDRKAGKKVTGAEFKSWNEIRKDLQK